MRSFFGSVIVLLLLSTPEVGSAPRRQDILIQRLPAITSLSFDGVPAGVYHVCLRGMNEIGTSPANREIRVVVS